MIAYKFLRSGAVGPFSGFPWPAKGEWVEAAPPLEICRSGVHACSADELPEWLSAELWRIELAGEVVQADGVLVAERGRLVDRVDAWDTAAALDFAVGCAARLRKRAEDDDRLRPFADDAEKQIEYAADPKLAAVVSSIARHAAELAEPGGFGVERRRQSKSILELVGD